MIKLILFFFDLLRWPISALGVNYPQFRAILEIKLMMDNRRPMSAFQRSSGKQPKAVFALTLFSYFCFGIFVGASAVLPSPLVGMTLIHAFVMVMVAMTLISDFSTVLLDTTDNAILQPRPVSGRTILVARTAHIVTYLSLLALSLSAAGMIIGAVRYHPLVPLVFIATLACSLCLVVFFANAFYLVAIRLVGDERIRDMVTWTQILMTIVFIGGYQILPRLIGLDRIRAISFEDAWWLYLCPPAWMAAPIDLLAGHVGRTQIVLSILGVAVPALGIFAVVRYMAPRFNHIMLALASEPGPSLRSPSKAASAQTADRPVAARFARWLCRDVNERAAFEVIWRLCARDRQFKRRTYPSVAMLFIMGVMFFLNSGRGRGDAIAAFQHSNWYLFILYFGGVVSFTALLQLTLTEQPDAAWVYRLLPIVSPGVICVAGWKVVMAQLVVPAHLVMGAIIIGLRGGGVTLDVVVSICASMLVAALHSMFTRSQLPFSRPYSVLQETGKFGRMMFAMFLPFGLCGVHFLARYIPFGVPLLIPIYVALILLSLRRIATMPWAVVLRGGG